MAPPFETRDLLGSVQRARSPDIYTSEEKQPYHVNEVPVPGCEFETEMLFRSEVARHRAREANNQEDRADDHVGAVEARRHEESGAINVAAEVEVRVRVFVGLHAGEGQAQKDREDQTPFESLPVVFKERMVRPGDCCARSQEDQGVEQRQMPGIKGLDPLRRPYAARDREAPNFVRRSREQRGVEISPEP